MNDTPPDITLLLHAASSGRRDDLDALMSAVYKDMRRLAAAHLDGERANHTLSPTALVHEAYVKLIDQRNTNWNDRLHFFALAARIIRRILIDHARSRDARKRGGAVDRTMIRLDLRDVSAPESDIDLIALDEALEDLSQLDARQARIVELRYFGGCTLDEVAEMLGIARRTADRDWHAAKAWLMVRLADHETNRPSRDAAARDGDVPDGR